MMNNLEFFQEICDKIKDISEAVESNNILYDKEIEELDWDADDYLDDINYIEKQRERTISNLMSKLPNYTFKIVYTDDDELITNTEELYNRGCPEIDIIKSIDIL